MTRRVLLRCDSTGDLYLVTAPSLIPHVFLVSQHTWHQRLTHPGRDVMHHLVSNNFISCNNEKPLVLCHACQLGKHGRLPFYLADDKLSRYKARLMANGSTQLEGVDVDETFSPVVKSVYMHQPPRFWDSVHPDYVDFSHSRCNSSLFIYKQGTDTAYLLLYVDDIVLTASSEILLLQIIKSLHQEFTMTDMGPLNYFLGISILRDSLELFLSQKKYAVEILDRAHMVNCNPSRTPIDTESKLGSNGDPVFDPTLYRSLAGSLHYLTFTRPDISYAVQQVCLYMHDPWEPHFRLLSGFCNMFAVLSIMGCSYFPPLLLIWLLIQMQIRLVCPTTRRSTSGYYVFLGNNLLSWSFKRQPMLSRFSAEVEYRGVANVVAETCWLRNLLRELHTPLSFATLVYCDNFRICGLKNL
ncbi:ribonuclease H-like domain-containing protein [Tanacetum coccineum]